MSVLKQLPADIQKEISDQLNKQHVDSNKLSSSSGISNNPNSSSGVNNNQQGCSHWFTANSNQTAKVTAQCDDEKPLDFNDEQEVLYRTQFYFKLTVIIKYLVYVLHSIC